MHRSRSMRATRRVVTAIALGTLSFTGPGCAGDFDATRPTQGRGCSAVK